MIENWELRVWSPTGTGPRIISRDASHIPRAGIRMQLTPEGDCREMTFDAKGAGLQLRPLDCVQLVYGGTALFYGEVRMGGNVRDVNGHRHVLRSLTQRFKEVLLPAGFSTPQQAAHLTVRAAVRAVVNSGQLGSPSTVLLDDALMPDLGFDCRAVTDGRQQTLYALLEQIAQDGLGLGVTVRFGVQPDRRFFCRVASTGRRTLGRDELTGATQWREPVAEVPVTAVQWFLPQRDGTMLGYLSRSPEADVYGLRVKRVTWSGGDEVWALADVTLTTSSGTRVDVWPGVNFETRTGNIQDAVPKLSDRNNFKSAARLWLDRGETAGEVALTLTSPNAQRLTLSNEHGFVGDRVEGAKVTFLGRQDTWAMLSVNGQDRQQVGSSAEVQVTGEIRSAKLTLNLSVRPNAAEWSANLWLNEIRAERLNTAFLDRMAKVHYKSPAQEPANIELRTFIAPTSLPKYVQLDSYQSIVEAWEYRLSADRGLLLGCLTGQAEDPAALAQAELIKARDGQSVITAITAGGK